jgi:hypothetical protein
VQGLDNVGHAQAQTKGWLHTNELASMSSDEIRANLEREIMAGENVLTRKPAGWA